MPFGVIVIGPPGSGKTTCCHALSLFLRASGRHVCMVNFDPAADELPYPCDIDVRDLVSLEQVQTELSLGPNGGLAYCFDYLETNIDWLKVCPNF
jgi:GPN-loop GTPase